MCVIAPGEGGLSRQVSIQLSVQPVARLPPSDNANIDHTARCHPFWHVRRSATVGEFNCDIKGITVKHIVSTDMEELKEVGVKAEPGISSLEALVLCIVNIDKVAANGEVILK